MITSLSRSAGGPSRSVQGLVAGLCKSGVEAWLGILRPSEGPWVEGVDHFVVAKPFDEILLSIKPEIVHLHGVWSLDIHRCAVHCRRMGIPYVIAPRGMLEPWSLKQKWLKKRVARFMYQDRDLKMAAALHATAVSEADQFRRLGFKNYCIVSSNGVNLPATDFGVGDRRGRVMDSRRALFVSRMHAKKGVLELVEAWSRVNPESWCCELVYTMNSAEERAYEQRVKDRILALGMSYQDDDGKFHSATATQGCNSTANFILTGPLDDEKKWEAYARANLFVLPTYSENFGIVIAEALWAGVPVITTKGTPWSDLVSHNCGWWIDLPTGDGCSRWDSLDAAIKEATALHWTPATSTAASLSSMGSNGHALVEREYTWKAVVGAMKLGYDQVLNSSEHMSRDNWQNLGDTCPIVGAEV